jgi:hypothetical protein
MSIKIIMKSFLKSGITNTLDGGIGDMLWVEDENVHMERDTESAPESSSEDENP